MEPLSIEVLEIRAVGPDMVALELESPAGFEALPGQFILVRGPQGAVGATDRDQEGIEAAGRHYTVSSPNTTDSFEITIEVDPDGTLTPWLASRSPGDTIHIEGPFGRTYYEAGDVAVIAGGPGIGPAVGIGERAVQAGSDTIVVSRAPLAHEHRLADLSIAGGTVVVVTTDLADAVRMAGEYPQILVFGFREFLERVRSAMEGVGMDPDSADYENFGPR